MGGDTRTQLLEAAARQFADKGFYGASIAGIADELGLTKQALIHHFGSKERLYGEVLQRISDQLLSAVLQASAEASGAHSQLERLLFTFYENGTSRSGQTQLLMRELLDNKRRAGRASSWYLKSFIDALVAMVRRVPGWEVATEADALATAYQLLGAINYFAISEPTLTRMLGKRGYNDLKKAYPARLRALIRASLDSPPPS